MKYFTFLLVLVLASENYSVALFPRSLLVSQDLCQPTLYLKHSDLVGCRGNVLGQSQSPERPLPESHEDPRVQEAGDSY